MSERFGRPPPILWILALGVAAFVGGIGLAMVVHGLPLEASPRMIASDSPVPPPSPEPRRPDSIVAAAPVPLAREPTPGAVIAAQARATSAPAASLPQLSSNDVMELQSRLKSLGFHPGPLDASAGPQTVGALTQYQQSRGLAPTGEPDGETLARLRDEVPAPTLPLQQRAQAPPRNAPASPPRTPIGSFFADLEKMFRGR